MDFAYTNTQAEANVQQHTDNDATDRAAQASKMMYEMRRQHEIRKGVHPFDAGRPAHLPRTYVQGHSANPFMAAPTVQVPSLPVPLSFDDARNKRALTGAQSFTSPTGVMDFGSMTQPQRMGSDGRNGASAKMARRQ
jgi:hypothetical protein